MSQVCQVSVAHSRLPDRHGSPRGEHGRFMFPGSLARGELKLVCGLKDLSSTLSESLREEVCGKSRAVGAGGTRPAWI